MTADSTDRDTAMPQSVRPLFVDTHGQLPPMWPRRVIFFANLLSIFFENEEQTKVLSEQVGELDSYSARLIPIVNLLFRSPTGEQSGDRLFENVLVVERQPDSALCHYLEHELCLSLPRIIVLRHEDYLNWGLRLAEQSDLDLRDLFGNVDQADSIWMDGYVTDETLTRFADRLGCRTLSTAAASRAGNNKLLLHQHLVAQGLPTLDTVLAESPNHVLACAKQLAGLGYSSAVVRAPIGASGIGMMRLANLNSPEELQRVPPYFFHEGPCLVQGWLAAGALGIKQVRSPSTQLFLNDEHIYAFDMTEQILSEQNVHEGNESPPPYLRAVSEATPETGDSQPLGLAGLRNETMRQAEIAGRWLHQTGYRGTASIDWLVVQRTGDSGQEMDLEVYVCEINARVTGATYPSLLAKHFQPSGAWLLRNLRLNIPTSSSTLLEMFDRAGHLFHLGRRSGILPLNFNFGSDGLVHKGQFVCIGKDSEECHRFLHLAEQDLPGSWNADRD